MAHAACRSAVPLGGSYNTPFAVMKGTIAQSHWLRWVIWRSTGCEKGVKVAEFRCRKGPQSLCCVYIEIG